MKNDSENAKPPEIGKWSRKTKVKKRVSNPLLLDSYLFPKRSLEDSSLGSWVVFLLWRWMSGNLSQIFIGNQNITETLLRLTERINWMRSTILGRSKLIPSDLFIALPWAVFRERKMVHQINNLGSPPHGDLFSLTICHPIPWLERFFSQFSFQGELNRDPILGINWWVMCGSKGFVWIYIYLKGFQKVICNVLGKEEAVGDWWSGQLIISQLLTPFQFSTGSRRIY